MEWHLTLDKAIKKPSAAITKIHKDMSGRYDLIIYRFVGCSGSNRFANAVRAVQRKLYT